MVNFAITGASGFIGRHFVPFLRGHGHNAVALTRNILESDNDAVIAEKLSGISALFHLAGRAHRMGREPSQNADDYFFDNVALTERLLNIAKLAGIRRFVFISSIGVNGFKTYGTPFHENDTPAPHNVYATSKHLAEAKVIKFCEDNGMEWVILRPPLVYGADAPGNLGKLQRMIVIGMPLPFANIRNKRSLISVENLCDIMLMSATSDKAKNQLYLVADGVDRTTPDLLRLLAALKQKRVTLLPFPQFISKAALKALGRYDSYSPMWEDLQVDTTKLHRQLGWTGTKSTTS